MIKEEYQYLNQLSEINNNTGIKFLHRAASPSCHCPMHMALATIRRMKGISSLVVGMPECGYYSRFVAVTPNGTSGELHYVYELDSYEVVFGCRKGLKNALLQMDKEGAEVIVIILTCVPALIGEDIEAVIEEAEAEMNARAIFIDAAHFKRNGYQAGSSDTLEQLVNIIEIASTPVKEKKINILGFAGGVEYRLFKELMISHGYSVEEFADGISFDQLKRMTIGYINIVVNTRLLKAAMVLFTKHKLPYISMADRYTAEDITKGYETIIELLQIENAKDFIEGKTGLENCLRRTDRLRNVSFIGTYPEFDTLPVTYFLSSLGMIPQLLHVEEYDENSNIYKSAINALGHDPYITYITDRARVLEVLKEGSRFLCLGGCDGLMMDMRIEDSDLRRISSLFGYERSEQLLILIMEKLDCGENNYGTI